MSHEEPTPEQLEALKQDMLEKQQVAVTAAYAYFCALPVGRERIKAHEVYQNLRLATRL